MQTNNLPETKENKSRRLSSLFPSALSKLGAAIIVTGVIIFAAVELRQRGNHSHPQPSPFGDFPTLAMSGGDPYIRALMRTISASESNGNDPYVLLYSGDHTHDLGQHPSAYHEAGIIVSASSFHLATKTFQSGSTARYRSLMRVGQIDCEHAALSEIAVNGDFPVVITGDRLRNCQS